MAAAETRWPSWSTKAPTQECFIAAADQRLWGREDSLRGCSCWGWCCSCCCSVVGSRQQQLLVVVLGQGYWCWILLAPSAPCWAVLCCPGKGSMVACAWCLASPPKSDSELLAALSVHFLGPYLGCGCLAVFAPCLCRCPCCSCCCCCCSELLLTPPPLPCRCCRCCCCCRRRRYCQTSWGSATAPAVGLAAVAGTGGCARGSAVHRRPLPA